MPKMNFHHGPGTFVNRILTLWWLKALGNSLFMWFFFEAYFYLLRHPAFTVNVLPLLPWDGLVPYADIAWVAYLSLWIYTALPAALQGNFTSLVHFGFSVGALCLIGLLCFYFWPTAVPAHYPFPADAPENWLGGVDAPGNACPSLHVASAVFSFVWLRHQLKALTMSRYAPWINGLWCLAIVLSTLSVRQHILTDVVLGALLGGLTGHLTVRSHAKRFTGF
jgi:membrane-associated phospholipid phosphatase